VRLIFKESSRFPSLKENYKFLEDALKRDEGTLRQSKIKNLIHIKRFHELLEPILKKYNVPVLMADVNKQKNLNNILFYRGGSPVYSLFTLTPGGQYINYNPFYHLWKNHKIDYDIVEKIQHYDMNRYAQPKIEIKLPEKYDLFPLNLSNHLYGFSEHPSQININKNDHRYYFNRELSMIGRSRVERSMNKTNRLFEKKYVMPRDEWATRDAIKYATENKRYTIFKKSHVVTPNYIKKWSDFEKEGIINEFTIYTDANMDYLIQNSNFVYSSDSMSSFQALVMEKPTATYYNTIISEIIPVIKTAKEMENIGKIKKEIKLRFLSWFYHKLSIDIYSQDAEEKIENIVKRFKNGERTKEIFS